MRVTLALMTFNQAPFLAEAIESALAQDYQPLRILISDNGSRDRTQDIVQSALQNYRGPHEVIATRFVQNTGSPSSHINALLPRLEDDIIVLQAGDDRSHPGRVSAVVKAFAEKPESQLLHHAWHVIDATGRHIGQGKAEACAVGEHLVWFASVSHFALGATLAIRRKLLADWPALPSQIFEDNILPFRAALSGPIVYLDQPLLDYRRHAGGTLASDFGTQSLQQVQEGLARALKRQGHIRKVRHEDLLLAQEKGFIDQPTAKQIGQVVDQSLQQAEWRADLFSPQRKRRLQATRKLWKLLPRAKDRFNLLVMGLWPKAWIAYRHWREGP